MGVKGVSASNQNQASVSGSLNGQANNTPRYTPQEQKTIRRIESTPNKGRDMAVIGRENFTPNMVDYVLKNNRPVAVDKLAPAKAKELGFAYPDDVRRTIHKSDIEHTLIEHGKNSNKVKKSGQKPVTKANIANWTKYADRADITVQSVDNKGNPIVISGKQINGYYAVVEQIRKGRNELSFKTMYFENGKLENHKEFKGQFGRKTDSTTSNVGSPKTTGSGVSANGRSSYELEPKLDLPNPNRLKTVATDNQTIPQSTEKSSGNATATQQKLSPPTNPETLKKAKAVARKNIIYVKTKTKQQAEEIAKTYGWDKTHTPRFDTISDKWVLVKNTYWNSQKSKDEKEDAVVADAVKSVQAATAKINQQVNQVQAGTPTANRSLSYQTANSQAVQPELDLTQTQSKQAYYIHTDTQREALKEAEKLGVLHTHTPHRDYESGKYILLRNDLIKNPTQTQKRLMEKYQSSVSNKSVSQSKNAKGDKQDEVSGSLKGNDTATKDKSNMSPTTMSETSDKVSGRLKQQKSFDPATVKPATDTQIKQAVVTPKRQAVNSEQAKEQANAFLRKELINKHSGLPATVHNSNLRKMISNSAAMKSINPQLHALAIANVDELYQNAIYGWRKTDRDNSPDIAGIHRLFATLRTEQGDFVVKMTVKEYTQPEQNNALYTVEALEVETQENSPAYNSVKQLLEHDKIGGNYSTNTTGAIESLIKNAQEVNNRLPETKQQTQKRLSQQLKDKANAIRESKNSVEHKNAIQQAVIDAVGLDNAKHIEIVTAAKAQAENDDLRNLSLDFVSQIEGFASADSGKITLIQTAFDSPAVAAFVAWHELGHRGIEIQGRKQWHKSLRAMMNNSPTLRRIAGKKYDLYHNQNGMRDFTAYDALEESIVDLYAAYKTGDFALFEDRNGVTLPNSWKQQGKENAILKMWNAVRAFFSRLFGRKINSDREIFALLRGLDSVQGYDFDPKSGSLKGISNNRYSLSAMKSVKANIVRGKKAMNKALTEKTDVHRAMYRNDIGWVDFVYGSVGVLQPNNKTKGAMGLSHIIEARMRKDKMTRAEVVKMLTDIIVPTIAQGKTHRRIEEPNGKSVNMQIDYKGYRAILVRNKGNNAWLLNGFELYSDGASRVGFDTSTATQSLPTPTRQGLGASEKLQAMKQVRVATNSALRTTEPILSRQGVGASVNVSNSVSQNANNNKRFSLASNNKALAKINQNVVNDLWQHDEFDWLQEDFADNAPTGKMLPKHKKLFDTAKKSKSINEFARVMSDIQAALQNGEIKNSKDILRTYQSLFERTAKFKDLKQYGKEELQAIADNPNFQAWFAKAHKFFKNTDGTPKVFYRGLKIDKGNIGSLKNNASENEYGAEFFTDNAIIASTYSTMIYPHNGFIQQVAINAEKPFIVPHTSGNDWNNLLKDYTVSQVVRLFKMAGFDTKPANWDSLSHRYDDTFATSKDTISFFVQTSVKTGFEFVFDKKPDDQVYQKQFDTAKFSEIWERPEWFSNNFFVRNLQSRGKFDSVVFKNIHDNGWQASQVTPLFGDIPAGTVIAVWGTEDNQAYAKELGNKGTFSKEDKRIFYSLKNTKPEPIPAFGENFDEFYHKGQQAVEKLLKEKHGQVVGAFQRNELGDIDLVWGEVAKQDNKITGYGLSKIIVKHKGDFAQFTGKTLAEKIANGLNEIISKGKVSKTHNGYNIEYNGYKVGLNQGWNIDGKKIGNNKWVVTAFDTDIQRKRQGSNSAALTEDEFLSSNSVTDNIAKTTPTVQELKTSLKALKATAGQGVFDSVATMIKAENAFDTMHEDTPKALKYSIGKSAQQASIAFGRELGTIAKQTYSNVKSTVQKVRKNKEYPSGWRVYLGNKWQDSLNVQLQFLGRRHIVDIFDKVFKGRLKKYSDLVSDMDAMKNSLSQKHDDLVRDWGKLPTAENDKLVDLMHRATLAKYDPDTKDGEVNYRANWNNRYRR